MSYFMKAFFLLAVLAVIVAACQVEEPDETPVVILEPECNTDADCATAGCSGQLCVTAEEAPGIITTCEFREEYSCLKETSCGCVEGQCNWTQTDGYLSCLEDLKG